MWRNWNPQKLMDCKMAQLLCQTVGQFLKNLNIELPADAATPLLGIYSRELKSNRQELFMNVHKILIHNSSNSRNNSSVHKINR